MSTRAFQALSKFLGIFKREKYQIYDDGATLGISDIDGFQEDRKNDTATFRKITSLVIELPHNCELIYPSGFGSIIGNIQVFDAINGKRVKDCKIVCHPCESTIFSCGNHDVEVLIIPSNPKIHKSCILSMTVTVRLGTPILEWMYSGDAIVHGTPLTDNHLSCRCTNLHNGTYKYSVGFGEILSIGKHNVTCKYEPEDRFNYPDAIAEMEFVVVGKLPSTILWENPQSILYSTALSPLQLNATCNRPGYFVYDPPASSVLPAGRHQLHADFCPCNPEIHASAEATVAIDVARSPLRCQWAKPFFLYDGMVLTSSSLNCICINDTLCTFIYDPPLGTALGVGFHVLSVTAITSDPSNFEEALVLQVTQEVKVKSQTSISWRTPDALFYPEPLSRAQLNAYVSGAFPGTMHYKPPLGTVLPVGVHSLSVTFMPLEPSRAVCEKTVDLEVLPGRPMLLWNNPYPILEGTSLGPTSLNCICSNLDGECGRFVYDPSMGSVLGVGKHALSVMFVPDDKNYRSASASATIIVNPRAKVLPELSWQLPETSATYPVVVTKEMMKVKVLNVIRGECKFDFNKGSVLAAGSHSLQCTFSPSDLRRFEVASISVDIVVTKATPVVEWRSFSLQSIEPLRDDHLNAICSTAGVNGTFEYSVSVGTFLKVGSHSLRCVFTPDDASNYEIVEASIDVVVERSIPQLEWIPFAIDMRYPSPIVAYFHLNAKCVTPGVSGKFEYSHKDGDVLPIGFHNLSVRFYPSDIDSFYGATATAGVDILP